LATIRRHVRIRAADNGDMLLSTRIVRFDPLPLRREGEAARAEAPRRGDGSDAEIVLPGRGLQFRGQVVALGVEGCRLATKCGLEPGTSVEVWLRTEGMPLRVAASLVERGPGGVAFKFQPVPERKAEQIRMLCRELGLASGEAAADLR
jgi:hypothetical protein